MARAQPGPSHPRQLTSPLLEGLRRAVLPLGSPGAAPPPGTPRASVLLLFDPASPRLPLLFMLRSAELRHHAGQIAFPGGSAEPTDADPVATALREAREEVGVDPDNVDVIGVLTPLVTAVSNRWLTPVVGLERASWAIHPDGHEVAEWFHIDLATLLQAPHTTREMERDGRRRLVHFYDVDGRVVWGVSAAILFELMQRLGRAD